MGNELNAINETDIQQSLTRALGLRDRVPVPVLSPELSAVIIAGNLTSQPPFDKKRVAGAGVGITSGVGSPVMLQFRNPADSGTTARVSFMCFGSTLSQEIIFTLGPLIAGATIADRSWLNTFVPGIPVCHLAAGSAIARPIFFRSNIQIQSLPYTYDQPVIVGPGFSIQVETIATNVTGFFSVVWEEFLDTPTK